MNRFKIISLVIALLVAQFSYAGHYHSVDDHHSETECFLCIHASFLDNAVPSDYLVITNVLLSENLSVADHLVVLHTRNQLFDSRAPPRQQ